MAQIDHHRCRLRSLVRSIFSNLHSHSNVGLKELAEVPTSERIGYQRKQKLAQQSPNNLGSAGTQIPWI